LWLAYYRALVAYRVVSRAVEPVLKFQDPTPAPGI